MDQKDLIIGGASGYSWQQLKYWVSSIKSTGFTGDIVLCVSNIDDATINRLATENVIMVGHQTNNMAPHVLRFFHIWNYLKDHPNYRNVIVTDTRDVIFQKNPSYWLDENLTSNKLLVASSEGMLYKDEPWGDNNILQSLGPFFHSIHRENLIFNVGTIAGRYSQVKDLLVMLFQMCTNRPIAICDQAMYNFIINYEPYRHIIRETYNTDSWAIQLGTTAEAIMAGSGDLGREGNLLKYFDNYTDMQPIIRDDYVFNPSNQLYTIVHQWDRIPSLKDRRKKDMKMYDGLFLINSAVCAPEGTRWSVFDNKTRFEQTLETLDSIDRICPNNVKVIFDCSPVEVPEEWLKTIGDHPNTWFLDMGKHPVVQMYSMHGLRSHAESYAMTGALAWLETQKFESKRIYKLSGRYRITDDFVLDDPSYKDSFVFLESHPTWMTVEEQNHAGVDRVYDLRLWHMDYSMLESFKKELLPIIGDICNLGIDVEHAYYKRLHNYKVIELPRIGVTGYMAPTGELINE